MAMQLAVKEGRRNEYPWAAMQVNDWFVTRKASVRQAAWEASDRYGTKCFAAHKQRNGNYRVERIA